MPTASDAGLSAFHEVLQRLGAGEPLEGTLDLIARRVCEIAGFSFCGIMLPDGASSQLHLAGSHGFPAHYAERLALIYLAPAHDESLAGSPTQVAMREARTIVLEDVQTDEVFTRWRELASSGGYRSLFSVPLRAQGQVIGVLNGYSRLPRKFSGTQRSAVETLAGHAALAVCLGTLVDAQRDTIAALWDLNERLERQAVVLERVHDIHVRLTDAVLTGAGFEAVIRTLASLIGRPAGAADTAGWLTCTSAGRDEESVQSFFSDVSQRLRARGGPSEAKVVTIMDVGDRTAVVGQILIGSELLGYVIIQAGDPSSVELDTRAVEHAATVLALVIVKERVARATEERLRSDFVFDLVNGREKDEQRLAERARGYGLRLGQSHRVVVAELDDWSGYQERMGISAQRSKILRQQALRVIEEVCASGLPGSLTSQLGDRVTIVAPTEGLGEGAAPVKAVIGEVTQLAARLAPSLRISAGIGGPASAAPGFVASYQQAGQCLSVLRRLGRPGSLLAVDELGVLRFILDNDHPGELLAMAHRILGPAIERDRTAHGRLLETLTTYLENGCDAQAAAAAIPVHVNTVRYRIRRVEELCGLQLKDPRGLVEVMIADLVLRLAATPAGS